MKKRGDCAHKQLLNPGEWGSRYGTGVMVNGNGITREVYSHLSGIRQTFQNLLFHFFLHFLWSGGSIHSDQYFYIWTLT